MTLSPLARRLLSWGLVAAALLFLALTIARNWAKVRTFRWEVDPVLLGLSVAAHVGVLAWGVFVWSRVLTRFAGEAPAYPALLRIWSLSSVARYVPGTVWQFVAAAELARRAGISRTLLLASMAVHLGTVLLAAALLGVATLPAELLGTGWAGRWAALGVVPLLAFVHPRFLNLSLGAVARLTRREGLAWEGSWLDGVLLLTLQLVSWLLYGGAFYLFVRSLVPLPPALLLPLAGVNAVSFLAGYLAVLAPGGLGVRELAMTGLLSPFLPASVAAVMAVLSRLWSVVAEVALAGVALLAPPGRWRDPPPPY